MKVRIKRVGGHGLRVPAYATDGAAGFDLCAVVAFEEMKEQNLDCGSCDGEDWVMIRPRESVSIPVGFAFEVPVGYELQVRGRSGLAFKRDIVACHSPGTIDSDYRGEVHVKLWNLGSEDFVIAHGDRIAQGIIAPVVRAEFDEVPELSETARGNGGFGSTGK